MTELAGKRVVVVGLGASGYAAARALVGLDAKVRVTDASQGPGIAERGERLRLMGAEVEIGGHDLDRTDADVAVLSPGVSLTAPVVTGLRRAGVEIMSEIELAYRLAECDFLAVTGTNGKTTTTALLARMLAQSGVPCVAAGNIGLPLIDAVGEVGRGGAIAVEVSSFQLAAVDRFRPRVAVLLNVAEDHTDWHGSRDAYASAKARVFANQRDSDVFLPNAEDAQARALAAFAPARVVAFSARTMPEGGIGVRDGAILWRDRPVMRLGEIGLPGAAGLEDTIAAAGAALEYGVDVTAVRRAAARFRALPHRLQVVATSGGVTYLDDSKATNPHATLAAVRGLADVVLIAGGRSKGIDLSPLATTVPPVRAVIALGEARAEVTEVFSGLVEVHEAATMDEAVGLAGGLAGGRGSVLLSPGCASLDMYKSYAARGDDFARAVTELIRKGKGGVGGES